MGWKNMISICPAPNFRNMFQGRSNGVALECQHTIKSHGGQLARNHKHDWLILILLAIIVIVLNIINPFHRFVGEEMMTDLRYPMKENTVPIWAVPLYAVLLPIFIFILYYLRRRDVYDLHHSILGLLFAVLITGVLTDVVKDAVGRPRPDFFWRCFPDGRDSDFGMGSLMSPEIYMWPSCVGYFKISEETWRDTCQQHMEEYDRWGNVVCHGKASDIREGHKSFPSGHTSWSFAGLGFLALYLAGKIKCFDRRGHVAKLCIIFLPILAACLVGVSRVDDYWHHWQDVFAGGLLGLVVATFCYLQFFPPPYNNEGSDCYAYIRAVEETRSITASNQARNGVGMQGINRQESEINSYGVDQNLDSSYDAMESGRR